MADARLLHLREGGDGAHRLIGQAVADMAEQPRRMRRPRAGAQAREMRGALRRRGIRWILHNRAEIALQLRTPYYKPRFSDDEWSILEQALELPVFERATVPPGVDVLRLRDEATSGAAPAATIPAAGANSG